LAIALALLVMGCQAAPPSPGTSPADPLAQAREAMATGDYATAALALRQFLASNPTDLEGRYSLAVSASHLNLKDEAVREFQWVLANGPAGSPEVEAAREWLLQAGIPVVTATPRAESPPVEQQPGQKAELGTISGKATRRDGGSLTPMPRLQLFLKGVPQSPVRDEYHVLRTDQEGNYRFTDVKPGEYMLTDKVAGRPTWRIRVSLTPGQSVALDLNPDNSAPRRDDFPQAR
jgi:hypothetical protein